MSERIEAYAQGMLEVARSEGRLTDVEDEVYRFSRTIEGNDELRAALTDPALPLQRKVAVIEDLLGGGRALATSTALITMVVASGRAADLSIIVERFVEMAAGEREYVVAEVRSAVELSDDQKQRLGAALSQSTGKRVDVKVVVDSKVMGGVVARIGDTVIDGSVRYRLEQLKELI
ncbi:MAG: ATP synthase F1 subunit delta [Acidimicrobiia bacterium]